jgi:hypothetical protein
MKVLLFGRVQSRSQEIREQLVIAKPLAFVVEPEDKHVGLLETGQDDFAVDSSQNGITQWCREAIENRGFPQKRLDCLRLLAQYFSRQVVDYVVVLAVEPGDPLRDIDALGPRVLLHRQRGHLQSGIQPSVRLSSLRQFLSSLSPMVVSRADRIDKPQIVSANLNLRCDARQRQRKRRQSATTHNWSRTRSLNSHRSMYRLGIDQVIVIEN